MAEILATRRLQMSFAWLRDLTTCGLDLPSGWGATYLPAVIALHALHAMQGMHAAL